MPMLSDVNTILIVIDVQSKLAGIMHEKELLLRNLEIIIRGANVLNLPILVTEQRPEKLGNTVPEIRRLLEDKSFISKVSFSCYGSDRFKNELESQQKKQVLIAGVEAHVCVFQTTMDLIEQGYEVHVISDAVSSRTLNNCERGLQRIASAGGIVTTTEMALFELLRVSDSSQFREIIRLVR